MVTEGLAQNLKAALDAMRTERDELDHQIALMEQTLSKLGVTRGPGRPRGAGAAVKRGPGRPKGSKNKAPPSKATAKPAKKKATKAKKKAASGKSVERYWSPAARKAAAERARKMWIERRKKKTSAQGA